MKILFDVTVVEGERSLYKSIPIWLLRILDTIKGEDKKKFVLLINPKAFGFFCERYPDFEILPFRSSGAIFPSPTFLNYISSSYRLRKLLNKYHFDCLLVQGGIAKNLYLKHKEKVVVVEHDMKTLKDRGKGIIGLYKRYMSRRTTFKYWSYIDRIITISEYTKNDILSICPKLSPDKISVVHNSVVIARTSLRPQNMPQGDYLLYVNTLQEYKNVATLIKAFNLIKDRTDLPLVLVGKSTAYWEDVMLPYICENRFEDRIVRLEGVSNEELRYLYEHASLFITPSTHEGFGYTPIEAAMCKCPVVSSTCEALPETTRGLLYYYNPPKDENALGNIILEVLSNPPSSTRLESIAEEYESVYSPDVQYNCILNLMREVCCHFK